MKTVRIGLIDGGVAPALSASVEAVRSFGGPSPDAFGAAALAHGTNVARLVLEGLPTARLLGARVFHQRLDAGVDDVVAALDWLVGQGVDLVNMSLGLRTRSATLERACAAAHAAGVLLVAAAPARGGPVWPAAYADCIAVSGDARCGPGELSWLGQPEVDVGACPFLVPGAPARGGGASYAAARFSGRASALLAQGLPALAMRQHCFQEASRVGPERRHA
ncbi:subtilisin-like serine protease QhpE [Azohydromonas caseinilytica]|uniref:S8 family serine peptidase n=1 Tax=Azohydromonas caseinilytica TaxID=2728836 RepID=A0A848FLQ9_9BURK|nr:S8 family serine peptidase [Azohydromonas caseinilytica]NML18731.1 S8 family serine peptidase [Azohydromonas caseinilytica]